jgi:hypothetical protein
VIPRGEIDNVPHGILMFAVPIIRTMKLLRRFEKLHLLLQAFTLAAEALPVLVFMLFAIALVFSVLIYLAERDNLIDSLPMAAWLSLVTMTTVGYGDMYPQTNAGRFITGVLIVITVLYMAVPLGIVGNAFTQTWNDRDRILLMRRTREALIQWGYTAYDIPVLFRLSDDDDDGEIDINEFRNLLRRMGVGFNDDRIYQLFNLFDTNGSGAIDDREFVLALFPNLYHDIYGGSEVSSQFHSSEEKSIEKIEPDATKGSRRDSTEKQNPEKANPSSYQSPTGSFAGAGGRRRAFISGYDATTGTLSPSPSRATQLE